MASQYKALVFSLSCLDLCCRQGVGKEWFKSFDVPKDGTWGVLKREFNGVIYILDANPNISQPKIVIDLDGKGYFSKLNPSGWGQALQRMYYIAKYIKHPKPWFPERWEQYIATNLLSVFAYSSTWGNERIIANRLREAGNVFFCDITSKEHPIHLESYEPNRRSYDTAIYSFKEYAQLIKEELEKLGNPYKEGVFDLSTIAYGGVSAGRTYSTWLPLLSEAQERFVHIPADKSQKLRGPAGTGKTLAMTVKALHELYESTKQESSVRILYVTHSWGVAEQVQSILDQLDEKGIAGEIDVLPLLTLAQLHLESSSIKVLGDDSYEGKRAQLQTLSNMVEKEKRGNWNIYESSCSPEFASRIAAKEGTLEANRLLWDLMLEFSCVIGANGIMPGFASEQKYRQIDRRPWMMPLENDADKKFVFSLYSSFITDLIGRDSMTTDQAINDFLNKLATFRWYAQRTRDGYDMIFVDEFHLFNKQEQMVFHNLTRNPAVRPVVFMAMDPRQSPSETYAEFSVASTPSKEAIDSELSLGQVTSINLNVVYRYTPQILSFLRLIDSFFPNLQLGEDWDVSIADAVTERESGPVPQLNFVDNESQEIEMAVTQALSYAGKEQSVAVLCVDSASFTAYKEFVSNNYINRFSIIESRDDIGSLRYQKKTIVLSQPHYVAGLQFDAVTIGGFKSEFKQYNHNQAYSLRRFLSDLYLAASRARNIVHFYSSGNQADLPDVLSNAVDNGVLEVKN